MTEISSPVLAQFRLNSEVYEAFCKQFKPIHVDNSTSEIQAGYQLGIRFVLDTLRTQLVARSLL